MGFSAFILPPVPGLVHCLVCMCAMPCGHISSQFRRLEIDAVFLREDLAPQTAHAAVEVVGHQ